MEESLKTRTVRALSWSLVQEIAQRGLQFGIGILLARMLGPNEFGLLAMLTIFIAVSQAILDSGFGSALIQRKEPTFLDECSVFYFNLVIGVFLAGLLCLLAPWISAFYQQPALTALTRALSLVLVINSLSVVQTALLVRKLDFRRQAIVGVTSLAISGVVALTMAGRGFGVWSLVGQQLVSSLVRTILLWLLNAWRPRALFSLKALQTLFGFGWAMLASSLTNKIFENLTSLVIGKVFTPMALGFYNRASSLQDAASQSLATVANRVTFPVFSKLQEDPARLKRGLQKAMIALAFIQFPLLIGLAAVARPLVLILLTDKWAPCIPYLQLLCFAGLLYPMHLLNLNVLMAVGRSDLFFRLNLIKRALLVLTIVITYRWGVLAMVWGQVFNSILAYFVNAWYTKRFIGYSIPEQLRDLLPYLCASAAMGLVVTFINLPLPPGHPAQLLTKAVVGMLLYALLCRGLRIPALGEMLALVRRPTAMAA